MGRGGGGPAGSEANAGDPKLIRTKNMRDPKRTKLSFKEGSVKLSKGGADGDHHPMGRRRPGEKRGKSNESTVLGDR